MSAAERRGLLLTRLHQDGKLVARDLAIELGLSEDSLRRDLRELAAAGLCQRVYGGALPVSPARGEFATRLEVAAESKRRVAARAALLITPGSTVILGSGTTALQWVTGAYSLTFGGLLLFGGRTGDLFGRRRMFMIGVGLFAGA